VPDTGSDSRAIVELQQRIEQDRARLALLQPGSPAYGQLRRRILRSSARLRDLEEDVKLRAHQVTAARLFSVLMGGILVLAGWGSWKLLIGVGVAAFGVWIADRLPDHFYRTGLGFERRAKT
jgi:hypothetical protein